MLRSGEGRGLGEEGGGEVGWIKYGEMGESGYRRRIEEVVEDKEDVWKAPQKSGARDLPGKFFSSKSDDMVLLLGNMCGYLCVCIEIQNSRLK